MNKKLFGWSALIVISAMVFRFTIDIFDLAKNAPATRGLFGHYTSGFSGAPARVFDTLSYFTIWSNIAIAIVLTLLYLNPKRDSQLFRTMRNTTLVMIVLTGVLYAVLIAPYEKLYGLNTYSTILEHYVTPVLALVGWLIAGPRGWMTYKESLKIYVVPIIFLGYTLVRGAITHTYPYKFFDVAVYGYQSILITMLIIIVGSYLFIVPLIWLDKWRGGSSLQS